MKCFIITFNRTLWNWNISALILIWVHDILLIVPYGIETRCPALIWRTTTQLLIVPYGIETINDNGIIEKLEPFNRTLWNWNYNSYCFGGQTLTTFNRTLWNWNELNIEWLLTGEGLLIVPYGIETYLLLLVLQLFVLF